MVLLKVNYRGCLLRISIASLYLRNKQLAFVYTLTVTGPSEVYSTWLKATKQSGLHIPVTATGLLKAYWTWLPVTRLLARVFYLPAKKTAAKTLLYFLTTQNTLMLVFYIFGFYMIMLILTIIVLLLLYCFDFMP